MGSVPEGLLAHIRGRDSRTTAVGEKARAGCLGDLEEEPLLVLFYFFFFFSSVKKKTGYQLGVRNGMMV